MIKRKTIKEKEKKIYDNTRERIKKKEKKYITRSKMNVKIKNSQSFINTDFISDNGIIHLKSGELAKVFEVQAIDLSLSSNEQKISFFSQLKYLYQIKDLDLRIYKINEQINLNANKDYISEMMNKYQDDTNRLLFLK